MFNMEEMILKIRRSTKEDLKRFDGDTDSNKRTRRTIEQYHYFLHIEMDNIIMDIPPSISISQIIDSFKDAKKEL